MKRMLHKLWNSSPREMSDAVRRRLRGKGEAASTPEWVRVAGGPIEGAELFLATKAVDTWQQMAQGSFDQFFLRVLTQRDLTGRTLWDIGSHFEYHALCFAAFVGPTGQVVAFEPNRQNGERIHMHLERNPVLGGRIRLERCAVADRSGDMTFISAPHLESGESTGSHLASAQAPNAKETYVRFAPETVATVSVDELLCRPGFRTPDVIKIDVEGAECLVLRGASRLLRERRPLLLIEVHHILQMLELQSILGAAGYKLTMLDAENATPSRCFLLAECHPQPLAS